MISVNSVCLSVCPSDDFRKPWRRKFIFANPVYLQAIRVKFVYEGHRVEVKVTGAKNVNAYYRNAMIAHSSSSIKDRAIRFACSMGFSTTVDRMVWLPSLSRDGSDHAQLNACIRRPSYDNFRKPWRRTFIFAHPACLQGLRIQVRIWRSSNWGQGQGHSSQKGRKLLFPLCKTSLGNIFRSIHKTVKPACSTGLSNTANRMMWPPCLSRDQKWRRVIKCTHSRVLPP